MSQQPQDTQRIFPMLAYDNAPAAIDFLCKAFGFEEQMRYPMPNGEIGHAELALNGHIVMLATAWRGAGMASPCELAGVHSQLLWLVADVDAHYQQAKREGAILASEPTDQGHGMRTYRALDPEGHRWMFASPIAG